MEKFLHMTTIMLRNNKSLQQNQGHEKPLEHLLSWANLIAAFPKASKKHYNFFQKLSYYHEIVSLIFMLFCIVQLFTAKSFFGEAVESIHLFIATSHTYMKQLNMRRRQDAFLSMFDEIRRLWSIVPPEHHEFLNNEIRKVKKKTYFCYFLLVPVVILFKGLSGLLVTLYTGEVEMPNQVWVPEHLKQGFYVGAALQSCLIASPLLILATNTSLIYGITDHVSALFSVLIIDLTKGARLGSRERKEVVKRHLSLLGLVKTINELISGMWTFEMMCASIQITMPGYLIIRCLREKNYIAAMQFMVVFVANIGFLAYAIYENGNKITIKVLQATYSYIMLMKFLDASSGS